MSTISLDALKKILFWQHVVLIVWIIEWSRRLYGLYNYWSIVIPSSTELPWDSLVEYNIFFRLFSQIVQIVLYLIILLEMRRLRLLIKRYIGTKSKESFGLLVSSQQKVWKYLGISFAVYIVLIVYYFISNCVSYL